MPRDYSFIDVGKDGTLTVPLLLQLLKDDDAQVRALAALALGHVNPPSSTAMEALIDATDDEDEAVRRAAGESLGRLKGRLKMYRLGGTP
jgi:HEAT repeat protein